MAIAARVAQVLQLSSTLAGVFERSDVRRHGWVSFTLEDEVGRFRVWAGNVGAHRVGRSSLDFRLRDTSHLQKTVLCLLDDLSEALNDVILILSGERTPWDETRFNDEDYSSSSSSDDEEDPHSQLGTPSNHLSTQTIPKIELEQIFLDITEIITCLFRFSMTVRQPASYSKIARAASIDKSSYEPYDIGYIRDKFPKAEPYLVSRLGKAVTARRRLFAYCESHQQKLGDGLGEDNGEVQAPSLNDEAEAQPRLQSTIASSLPEKLLTPMSLDHEDDATSNSGLTETSFASSANGSVVLCPPPLPREAPLGKPFQCKICYGIVETYTTGTWRKHVFKDLHPYVCTFEDCPAPEKLFERRSEWFAHELQLHRRNWQCLLGCVDTFRAKESFEKHLRKSHSGSFNELQLPTLLKMSETSSALEGGVCPLCHEHMKSMKQLCRHLGRHCEQLALFALPMSMKGEEDDEDGEYGSSRQRDDSVEGSAGGTGDSQSEAQVTLYSASQPDHENTEPVAEVEKSEIEITHPSFPNKAAFLLSQYEKLEWKKLPQVERAEWNKMSQVERAEWDKKSQEVKAQEADKFIALHRSGLEKAGWNKKAQGFEDQDADSIQNHPEEERETDKKARIHDPDQSASERSSEVHTDDEQLHEEDPVDNDDEGLEGQEANHYEECIEDEERFDNEEDDGMAEGNEDEDVHDHDDGSGSLKGFEKANQTLAAWERNKEGDSTTHNSVREDESEPKTFNTHDIFPTAVPRHNEQYLISLEERCSRIERRAEHMRISRHT